MQRQRLPPRRCRVHRKRDCAGVTRRGGSRPAARGQHVEPEPLEPGAPRHDGRRRSRRVRPAARCARSWSAARCRASRLFGVTTTAPEASAAQRRQLPGGDVTWRQSFRRMSTGQRSRWRPVQASTFRLRRMTYTDPVANELEENPMPAYLIVDCEVTDPERYEVYKQLAPPAIAKYGGRYLVRGGDDDAARRQLAAQSGRGARVSGRGNGEAILRFAGVRRGAREARRRRQHEYGARARGQCLR